MDIVEWIYFPEIDSTSSWLKRHFKTLLPDRTVVWAKQQTQGRGRFERVFDSKPGGLYFSIFILPDFEKVSQKSLVVSFSLHLIDFVERHFGFLLEMKPPNDIYYGSAKMAGVLIENSFLGQDQEYCIMGIGMNVNQSFLENPAPDLSYCAISLSEIIGRRLDLDLLLMELLATWSPPGLCLSPRWRL
jgi:BirA family transcriptional regulator, biotin operon repressor / biotin---[acetyl-CoA-carboxylase] ligase